MDSEIYDDSVVLQAIDGRTVQAVIGRNVSFTFSNITTTDDIFIRHNTSLFLSVWPAQNVRIFHKEPERVRASVDTSLDTRITVTVCLLNITRIDSGIYTVAKQLNSDEFIDCVLLQVNGK
ncbi:hypothetical protein CHS0354_040407 [Potamilus streckersoni]|uniref:Uncharacterized protein n=1 Tax=Potamilus streckersoni TaxID=2493646 RepID=A0AAE0T024_9BIVA|nr:hypothetical protein CHS0354_040407 [Potamilus streckersoni]